MRVTVRQILSYLIYVSATCRFSDLVYLGLTSAKWCSWISVTGILTDLTSYRPPEKIDLPQTGLSYFLFCLGIQDMDFFIHSILDMCACFVFFIYIFFLLQFFSEDCMRILYAIKHVLVLLSSLVEEIRLFLCCSYLLCGLRDALHSG